MKGIKIQELPLNLRPREKAALHGVGSLSDRELLALFIRTGTTKTSALGIADEILLRSNGLRNFLKLNKHDFISISGIKDVKAIELLAIGEMSRRIVKPSIDDRVQIGDPDSLIQWLNLEIGYETQEHFLVVYLNNQNRILSYKTLFKGTIDRSVVHPRDVFREAIHLNATRTILVHNHPGGTLSPSQADIHVTHIMISAGDIVGIDVIDHLIVAHGQFCSIRESHQHLFERASESR